MRYSTSEAKKIVMDNFCGLCEESTDLFFGYLEGGLFAARLTKDGEEISGTGLDVAYLLDQASKEQIAQQAMTACNEFVQAVIRGGKQSLLVSLEQEFEVGIALALTEGGHGGGLLEMEKPISDLESFAGRSDFTWELEQQDEDNYSLV